MASCERCGGGQTIIVRRPRGIGGRPVPVAAPCPYCIDENVTLRRPGTPHRVNVPALIERIDKTIKDNNWWRYLRGLPRI